MVERQWCNAANPELAKAMRQLRSSNAAQPHVLKRHKGSRQVRQRKAIADSNDS